MVFLSNSPAAVLTCSSTSKSVEVCDIVSSALASASLKSAAGSCSLSGIPFTSHFTSGSSWSAATFITLVSQSARGVRRGTANSVTIGNELCGTGNPKARLNSNLCGSGGAFSGRCMCAGLASLFNTFIAARSISCRCGLVLSASLSTGASPLNPIWHISGFLSAFRCFIAAEVTRLRWV